MAGRAKTEQELIKCLIARRIITFEGCWLWKGLHNQAGYGRIMHNHVDWTTHRLAFKLFRPEEFKKHLFVLHKVDCKNRDCFNPDHLYCGNQADNIRDMLLAGTNHQLLKTHCPQGHEYTIENTYLSKGRHCKICMKIYDALKSRGNFHVRTYEYVQTLPKP